MISLTLAAGYATRLYPLTQNFPKPLLPIGDATILDRMLGDVDQIPAVTRHVVVTNHRFYPHFKAWKEGANCRLPIDIVDDGTTENEHRLGAVRDIALAIERLSLEDDLLVMAGDNVLDFSLSALTDAFFARGASTILCYREPDLKVRQRCGIATLDADMRVLAFHEKPNTPPSEWAVPPFYAYARKDATRIHEAISEGCGVDAPGSLVAYLCARTPVFALPMPGHRHDVGDLAGYRRISEMFSGKQE